MEYTVYRGDLITTVCFRRYGYTYEFDFKTVSFKRFFPSHFMLFDYMNECIKIGEYTRRL